MSLKVLRLSRPSLATQTALPATAFGNGLDIAPSASQAYPTTDTKTSSFPLTPLLTLPSAFGAAYVGETFTCTLCANNEVQEGQGRAVSGVKIVAELQTPSDQTPQALELSAADGLDHIDGADIPPASTLQRTLRHELKEEGTHVLAVTITYTETRLSEDGGASGGRVRSFRKLYQFVAQQLIAVRSKITLRKRREKSAARQWILEAQLENVGEQAAVLEKVWITEREGVRSKDFNDVKVEEGVALKVGDVEQVMFLLEETAEGSLEAEGGRVELARLNVDWRSAMGEKGALTTGWLGSRGR